MPDEQEYRPSDIVLVRHGESVWNAWGKERKRRGEAPPQMQGKPDHMTPLTERGLAQARQTGHMLNSIFGGFDVIYTSPYVRTRQTAREMQAHIHAPIWLDLLLVGQQFGDLDAGVAPDAEEYRKLQGKFEALKRSVGKFYAVPSNGESWWKVALRTHDFLEKLFRPKWHGKKVLVVSHAVTIATFLYHLDGRDEEETVRLYEEKSLDNCGVVRFSCDPNTHPRWRLVFWNKNYAGST